MKKHLISIICTVIVAINGYAQLSGTKTIPGDYPSLAAAISDLNANGVGNGGVTFNMASGYTETFTSPLNGYITTLTASSANPVIFQKSGSGANPIITASTGTGSMDAVIAIVGCDYITFDGINIQENPSNTTSTAQMEWGYALLKTSLGDGTQNITIKNCNINLATNNTATTGIYSASHSTTSTTTVTPNGFSGTNSYLKIYSNNINCYNGIWMVGYNDVGANNYAFYDQNNEIGKDGANTITNIGGLNVIGYGIYASYQNNFKVANNNITSATAGTATAIYGLYLFNSNNANYDVFGNTVSIQYNGPGNSSLYPIWAEMGSIGQFNTINIYNNTVTNCTFPTFTTGSVRFINIANAGVNANVYGNTVSNNVIGSPSVTATGNIYYIVVNKSSQVYGPLTIYNNTITGNSRLQSTPASSITYFLWAAGSGSKLDLHHNTITNNVVTSLGNSYGINSSLSIASSKIFDNTVSGISSANGTFYGINLSSSSNNVMIEIFRNKIQNIQGDNSATIIHGIFNSSSATGNLSYIYNNMIGDLRAPQAVQASVPALTGINNSASNYLSVYNNSVYLNATSVGANFGSAAFHSVTSMAALELKNNIFVNTSVAAGTGTTASIRFTNSTITNYLLSSNNNLFFAGTPGPANVLYFDGTNKDQTLTAFQNRVYPRESQSVTEMPPFISIATGTTNLHLQTSVATQCESGGSIITSPAISTDYDLDARFPNPGYPAGATPPVSPDMGADEFGGIPADLTAPLITYSPLSPTNSTAARTLTVTITDNSGVPVAGAGLPMLYWKINGGSYTGVQGVNISPNTYTFTFGNGVVTGDVVWYYIVAQDMATVPNVTAKPFAGTSGYTANPPSCATAPTNPESYTVTAGFSGVFHVGVGKDYATLTAAAADINSKILTGPVTLILDDATYPSETYPISFNSNAGSSATNLLTIKPNTGVSPVFEAQVTTGIIDLNGIDFVLIDGSNNGTYSKNLTFSNPKTLTAGTYAVAFKCSGSPGSDPATNITIRNCIIKNIRLDQSSATNASIRFIAGSGSFENIIIDRNIIHTAFTGIQIWGTASARTKNIQITNNTIGSTIGTEAISRYGVDIQFADNTLVENNEIMGPIDGSLNTAQSGVIISNYSTNSKIRRNNIHTFWRPSDDGWGCYGVYYLSDASTVTEISNNVIYDIHSGGSAAGPALSNTYGILARNGGNLKIVHNTINLTGAYLSATLDASSACIGFWQQVLGNNEIRNNILSNSQTMMGGATPTLARAYGIMISGDASLFSTINNNDYYITGANGSVGHVFTQQQYLYYPTLASWQAYTGQEANSVSINPEFTSNTNLLPTSISLNNKGFYLSGVPQDITGALRNNPSDMGAYEFGYDPFVHTLQAASVTSSSATIHGEANAAGSNLTVYFDYGTTTSYGTSLAASPSSISGTSLTSFQLPLSSLNFATKYHYRARSVASNGMISYGVDSTFTTLPIPPAVITTAASSITSSGATLNGSVNPNGGTATISFQYGLTTSYGSTIAASPATLNGLAANNVSGSIASLLPYTTYHYRVLATNISGTTYGNDMTFTTQAIPSTVVTLVATSIIGPNATLNGTINANYAPTNATFEWGLTTSYGNTVTATPTVVSGNNVTAVSALITGLPNATLYHYRCVGNGPGGIVYGNDMVFTSDCPTPSTPGPISGLQSVCKNSVNVVYSVTPVSGATGYNWTVPDGASIVSGVNTNTITVNYSLTSVSGNVTVTGSNSCGTGLTSSLAVIVNELPVPAINGPASICAASSGIIYTTQPGMTGYVWAITGGTITAGAGTNSITVTWNTPGNQAISVNYANSNGCMANQPTSFPVTVNALPVPTISGPNSACETTYYLDYSTEPGMTNYIWDMSPNSGTITLTYSNTVTVFWTTPGAQWLSVSYTDANGCTASAPTVFNVTVNPLPGTPGAINGSTTVCPGQNGVPYSVAPVANANSYVWTLPAGATVASGLGTNSITVDFSQSAQPGNISVLAQNNCGNGVSSTPLAITLNSLPGNAGPVEGPNVICQGTDGVTYSVPAISGASTYFWTVPFGANIVGGAGTNTIVVNFGLTAQNGTVTVYGSNSCGSGAASSILVTVNAKPATPIITQNFDILSSNYPEGNQWYLNGNPIPGAIQQTYQVLENGTYTLVTTINGCSSDVSDPVVIVNVGVDILSTSLFSIYPNPASNEFHVVLNQSSGTVFDFFILNANGSLVYQDSQINTAGQADIAVDVRNFAPGLYTVIMRSNEVRFVKQLVIKN